jgi:hypothetical protein
MLIESVGAVPLATMSTEASANPVEEPESEKTTEQPNVLSPPAITGLSKLSITTTRLRGRE